MGIKWFNKVRYEYRKRRDIILEELSRLPGVKTVKPRGAFYVSPTLKSLLEYSAIRMLMNYRELC